jgi:preprotein translocase subunit SecY
MKGVLIGMLFASEGIAMGISALITLIVAKGAPASNFAAFFGNTRDFYKEVLNANSSCRERLKESLFACTDGTLSVYLIFAVIAVIFTVLFGVGACMYKNRRRDADPYLPIWLMEDKQESKMKSFFRKCCC